MSKQECYHRNQFVVYVAVQGYIEWDSIWELLVPQTKRPLNSHSVFILVKSSESNWIPKFAEGNILWTLFGNIVSIVFIHDGHNFFKKIRSTL